jgi:hypothetical protein
MFACTELTYVYTGGPNCEMVHILWNILPLPSLHGWWILPRKTKNQQRSPSASIPSSKSPQSIWQEMANNIKWLLSRQQRARYDPNYRNPSAYYNTYPDGGQYGMHPMPPPMYDPSQPPPPTYQPPAGGTKVDPSQWRAEPTGRPATGGEPSPAYEAPPGPPPAAVQANHTGGSTVSNNPYRL